MTDQKEIDSEVRLRKISRTPFAWQAMATMRFIRQVFHGKRVTTAIAIYQAFTECASEQGKLIKLHTSIFYTAYSHIAEKSGKSVSTIKRYAKEFRDIKILAWKVRKKGKTNLLNKWALLATPIHNSEPTSTHDNKPGTLVHNNELPIKETEERNIYNKRKSYNFRRNGELKHIGDVLNKTRKSYE